MTQAASNSNETHQFRGNRQVHSEAMIDPDRLLLLVRTGLMTEAEVTRIRVARERFLEAANAALYTLTFLACGQKPKA